MNNFILIAASLIILCVFINKLFLKMGVPVLLGFIFLGILVGQDGIFGIEFTNYNLVGNICTVALIFIMFYGGFSTNIKQAKPVLKQAALLAGPGVALTALFTGLFAYLCLGMPWLHALLLGSVIASTDAASVFSVLRSYNLNLRYNSASLLEVESGSNDPVAYMLTIIVLQLIQGKGDLQFIIKTVVAQIVLAIVAAWLISKLAAYLLNKMQFATEGFELVFIMGIALVSYALPSAFNGNGYLSAYICGLLLGNKQIKAKRELVSFWSGITGLMQIVIFFLLGLLSTPSLLPAVFNKAILVMLALTFLVRPLVVYLLLLPFKVNWRQLVLLSFAGLRGAASIVFAIMVIMQGEIGSEIFHITFLIVLLSLGLQGVLLPKVAKLTDMIEPGGNVMKTFTDYAEDLPVQFMKFRLQANHLWVGKKIMDLVLPPQTLLVYLENEKGVTVPNGETLLRANDKLILAAIEPHKMPGVSLSELEISEKHEYVGQALSELNLEDSLVVLIKRGDKVVIPDGRTVINAGDVLICNRG